LNNRLISKIRKLSRRLSLWPVLRVVLVAWLLLCLMAACQHQPSFSIITEPPVTDPSTTASSPATTPVQTTTSGETTTDRTTSGTTPDTTPATTATSASTATTGTSAEPTGSTTLATTTTLTPTKQPTGPTSGTPAPTPTRKPTATPALTPASTTAATTAPAASGFPYKNYGTFFRDDYGQNSSIISSEDGGIQIDCGCAPHGVALIRVDSIPADHRCKVIVTANGSSYQYDILYRGRFLGLPLQLGNGSYKVTVYEEIATDSFSSRFACNFSVELASGLKPFTASSLMCDFSRGSACVQKAGSLCSGINTATGRVDAVYRWIVANIDYDRVLAGSITSGQVKTYVPNPDTTYNTRKGICFDYAALMCAMLRSQGIPTRLIVGQTALGYHAWNEVYFAGTGWVIVASFSWQEISGSGWVMFDTTFAAGGMTPESIQGTVRTKQKTY
jgi:hypothetical protein